MAQPAKPDEELTVVDAHNRRLIVLFFDLSSMQPADAERAVTAARDYVDHKITPADLPAVASLGTSLRITQDFTSNRDLLMAAINRLSPAESAGFDEGATADAAAASQDTFTPDDTEFNLFNTDQRLESLRRVTDALASIPQKTSLVHFSSGMTRREGGDRSPTAGAAVPGAAATPTGDVRILTSVAFFKGRTRVHQTSVAEIEQISDADRKAVIVKARPCKSLKVAWWVLGPAISEAARQERWHPTRPTAPTLGS